VLLLFSCKDIQESTSIVQEKNTQLEIKYAEGFSVEQGDGYSIITLKNPWPGAEESYRYVLEEKGKPPIYFDDFNKGLSVFDAVVQLPVNKIVVTSTTHIPSLDMLGVTHKLVGFPNLNYISSEVARNYISEGNIKELGQNEAINTEVLIDLAPDVVVSFAVDGSNTSLSTIKKASIPVLYNADWTETHPLGKAEWIKYFGVLFGKEKEADSIFDYIETEYFAAKKLTEKVTIKPTVMSGAMYKDIWYMPQGNSWAAQFINDANGDYLWKDSEGTGSLSMSLESVLEKAKHAQFWIGPGQFTSVKQFQEAHSVYNEFDALKKEQVYTFTAKKGATGGVLYYELAPNRPDLVLKDIIAILHPDLLPEHELYFFSKVE